MLQNGDVGGDDYQRSWRRRSDLGGASAVVLSKWRGVVGGEENEEEEVRQWCLYVDFEGRG